VEQQLLDLNSSWDNSGQGKSTSDLPTDMTQILEPLKKEGGEETEDTNKEGKELAVIQEKEDEEIPIEGGVRKFSVSKLSQLFDKGLVSQQNSSWSSELADYKPEKEMGASSRIHDLPDYANLDKVVPSGSSEDYVNLDSVIISDSTQATSQNAGVGGNLTVPRGAPEKTCQVMYDYQAQDATEVSILEGDLVTPLPRDDASPGWVMVRLADGTEGWVPQAYLEMPKGGESQDEGATSGNAGGGEEQRKEVEVVEEQVKESGTGQVTSMPSPTDAGNCER